MRGHSGTKSAGQAFCGYESAKSQHFLSKIVTYEVLKLPLNNWVIPVCKEMFPLFNEVCLPANIISHGPLHAICKRNHSNENDIVTRREEES